MLKSQCIKRQKINRHSSQLAIRKSSANSNTPRDDESELNKIRKTTFWMKKNIASGGVQNLVPNNMANCGRKVPEMRNNRQAFSMKVITQHSETDSICNKNNEDAENNGQINSKLCLLQKSQRQLMHEVNLLVNENLPKLSTCHQLFVSLSKNIKLVIKQIGNSHFQRIMMQYTDFCSKLFDKVLKHSSDFVSCQKSANLISKVIQLQKQNSKLVDRAAQLQKIVNQIKNQQIDKKQTKSQSHDSSLSYNLDFNRINYQRIVFQFYQISQPKYISSNKINLKFKQVLDPILRLNSEFDCGKYSVLDSILKNLTECGQGQQILKMYINQQNNKTKLCQQNNKQPLLYKHSLFSILKNNININILKSVKVKISQTIHIHKQCLKFGHPVSNSNKVKKINSLMQNHHQKSQQQLKITLKDCLNLLGKFAILRDKFRGKQIVVGLVRKIQVGERKMLAQQQAVQLSKYLEDFYSELFSAKAENVEKLEKLSRLNSKRFVNCINLYQKKKKSSSIQKFPIGHTLYNINPNGISNVNTNPVNSNQKSVEPMMNFNTGMGKWVKGSNQQKQNFMPICKQNEQDAQANFVLKNCLQYLIPIEQVVLIAYNFVNAQLDHLCHASIALFSTTEQPETINLNQGWAIMNKLLNQQIVNYINSNDTRQNNISNTKQKQSVFQLGQRLLNIYGQKIAMTKECRCQAMKNYFGIIQQQIISYFGYCQYSNQNGLILSQLLNQPSN